MDEQYLTERNLAARIDLHERFSENKYGFQRWVFDHLGITSSTRVLELGCGTGALWRQNSARIPSGPSIVLTDASTGMVVSAAESLGPVAARVRPVVCAAPLLSFSNATFDCVIANHMLYHVRDLDECLAAIRRVLNLQGRLVATTNGRDHLHELSAILREMGLPARTASSSFMMESGAEILGRTFNSVNAMQYHDSLAITEPDALLDYVSSTSDAARTAIDGPAGLELRRRISRTISTEGAFRVSKSTGLFIARL